MTATGHPLFSRELRFVHRVNSRSRLAMFLASNAHVAEGDVRWGIGPDGRAPVMAHPPRRRSDLELAEWIDRLTVAGRALKVDFKDPAAIEPAIALLAGRVSGEQLIAHLDLVRGPAGRRPRFDRGDLDKLSEGLPGAVISIGATTRPWSRRYKTEHVDALIAMAAAARAPVTCALRLSLIDRDPESVRPLLDAGLHVTIWNSIRYNPIRAVDRARLRRQWPGAWLDLY